METTLSALIETDSHRHIQNESLKVMNLPVTRNRLQKFNEKFGFSPSS